MKEQKTKYQTLKSNDAITLIALVITVIILLILAMVSIRLVINGGIVSKTEKGVNEYKIAEEKEKIAIAYNNYKMGKYTKTEEQGSLETYFLGKNIENLLDEENSGEDFLKLKDIEIIVKPEDIVQNGENLNIYFDYNGHRYKLTVNGEGIIQAVETEQVLVVPGAAVKGDETDGWLIRFEETGNRYPLSPEGTIGEVEKTIDLVEGSLAKAYVDGELQITDKVNYIPESGKSITVEKEECGSSQKIVLSTDQQVNIEWQVMEVNDATGVVTLIAVNPIEIQNLSTSYDYLVRGKVGYYNGPNVLNKLCAIYGTGKGATGSRSLTIEDVDRVLKFDKTKYENHSNDVLSDDPIANKKYGNQTTYYAEKTTWNPEDTYQFKDGRKEYIRPNNNYVGNKKVFTDIDGNVATDEKPITITNSYYSYAQYDINVENKIINMIFNSKNALLASTLIETRLNEAYWGIFKLDSTRIMTIPLYWSDVGERGDSIKAIRPVVTLEANVLGEKDASGVWQLK